MQLIFLCRSIHLYDQCIQPVFFLRLNDRPIFSYRHGAALIFADENYIARKITNPLSDKQTAPLLPLDDREIIGEKRLLLRKPLHFYFPKQNARHIVYHRKY